MRRDKARMQTGRSPRMVRHLAVVVPSLLLAAFSMWSPSIEQPIAFNHRLHIEDVGLECTDCHLYAETGVRATIPNIEVCADCHAEAQSDSPEEARLVEYIQSESLVPWRKIYRVPQHVYFSHRRHTSLGEIPCQTCHGQMESRETPVTRAEVAVTMDFCMTCHEQAGASNDCQFCHR
ncbi:MAG: cytochrome c3 family protein [Acidobacteriota bacterium]